MTTTILCTPQKGGCGNTYEVDEEKVKTDKFVQCPHCSRIAPNPLYEGENK